MFRCLGYFWIFALLSCVVAREDRAPGSPDWNSENALSLLSLDFDNPEVLVPADVHIYARLEAGSSLLAGANRDPLAEEIWAILGEIAPKGFWAAAAPALGMSEDELLQALLGNDLAVIDRTLAGERGPVILTRVRRDILERLPEAAGLQAWQPRSSFGPWSIYGANHDEAVLVMAMGGDWLAVANADESAHLFSLLSARVLGIPLLSSDERFVELRDQLPEDRYALIFTRTDDREESHAISITKKGDVLEASYVARSKTVHDEVKPVKTIAGVDFGTLPEAVVVAGTVNELPEKIPGESLYDLLLFPHSFRKRVLPRIAPPLRFFVGKIKPSRIDPDPGFTVPVFGVAVRMEDPRVARDLDKICSGLHFFASLSQMSIIKGFFGIEEAKHGDSTYHLADFGPLIRASTEDSWVGRLASLPSSRALTQIAYGAVGDEYVICSQEMFLRDWHEASRSKSARFEDVDDFDRFDFKEPDGLIVSVMTRGAELSALVEGAVQFLQSVEGEERIAKELEDEESEKEERREREKIERPMRWFARGLEHKKLLSLQIWHGEDGLIRGKLIARDD